MAAKPRTNPPLDRIYQQLYEHFGPQGWWPTTPSGQTRPRYYPGVDHRNLSPSEQWEIIVGALLTQNTAWHNVEQALAALSARRALDLEALQNMDLDELALLIRPSGYYNQKAHRLQHIARYIAEHYEGNIASLLGRPVAPLRRELLALKGIGPETADSILLYAARYPVFVVDAYTRRICARLGLAEEQASYSALQALFVDKLPADPVLFNEYHALLVKHATVYCRARPQCPSCCLKRRCQYAKNL